LISVKTPERSLEFYDCILDAKGRKSSSSNSYTLENIIYIP
jgi:hypothetical protein